MTQGIFFDLGGTLFSYRNVPGATVPLLLEAVERLNASADQKAIKDAYTQAGRDVNLRYAEKHYYLHRDFFCDTFVRFSELLGTPADDNTVAWYEQAHREAIVACLSLKPDCIDTLQRLADKDLYLSVVSNIDNDMLEPLIEREDLGRFFHHWTSSESAQSCKPHHAFFSHALALSQLEPDRVLFVGDSPEHDIAGAAAAGMRTALVLDGGIEPPLQTGKKNIEADHTLDTLSKLLELV